MRYRIFLDTNILLSGIFFEGNESKILDLVEADLITCEDVIEELHKVVHKKLKYLKDRTLEIAMLEVNRAISDITVLKRASYRRLLPDAERLITHKKDVPILAAVLSASPDYFLTGDAHFSAEDVREAVMVMTAKAFLDSMKKGRVRG
ncbi:MAG: PIN domain-containing protein [Nitrospirae bacterium]|nr:PIN domain-containing protein [Nitrospirota bacterium]